MGLASSLFGAFLIGVALVLQRWSAISWEESSLKSADNSHAQDATSISSRGQLTRRTWTNALIGLIGVIMIVSTRLPRGPWWLGAWTLIGLLLAMIVIMAMIDLATTWMHYRRALSHITEKSLGQSESRPSRE
jgi:cell division protein FtsW (lipid II flippase)